MVGSLMDIAQIFNLVSQFGTGLPYVNRHVRILMDSTCKLVVVKVDCQTTKFTCNASPDI